MSNSSPLYLGFDLSTQQLKGLAVTSDLRVVYESRYDFDADSPGFGIKNGVLTNDTEHEIYAPVALWLRALDVLLARLQASGLDFSRVRGIGGAGQQHGSVYWSEEGEKALGKMDGGKMLEENLRNAFSHPFSPNWQDASTQAECDEFDAELGGPEELARVTGSKAHHRFTGPQILRFIRRHPSTYTHTTRISLVSSFLASLFLTHVAPIDISDVCGMNLWDISAGTWHQGLVALAASSASPRSTSPPNNSPAQELQRKLGAVHTDPSTPLGTINPYFCARYGFHPSCTIAPFTGDNPATILALPLRPNDAIVSLGTSTTFLMSTPHYQPDPSTHFFNHPTTKGLYMFMLCYKNGGLAREQVRDAINADLGVKPTPPTKHGPHPWHTFNALALSTPPLGQRDPDHHPQKLALYFPRPEIVPPVRAGVWRFLYSPHTSTLLESPSPSTCWTIPADDARAILESQLLSLRLRSRALVSPPAPDLPPQPRRVYLVGGGSRNRAIATIAGEVLGGAEGVWRLDVGGNACALGAAYKAVWTVEGGGSSVASEGGGAEAGGKGGESFEVFVGERWREGEFAARIAEGYQGGLFERYGGAVGGLERVEAEVVGRDG